MTKSAVLLVGLMAMAFPSLGADLTGTWTAAVVLDAGAGSATFTFKQTGEVLSGTYSGVLGSAAVSGTVKGEKVEWSFDSGQAGKVSYTGVVEGGSKITGTTVYGQLGGGTFTAEKQK